MFFSAKALLAKFKADIAKPVVAENTEQTFESNTDQISFAPQPAIVRQKQNPLETVHFASPIDLKKNEDGSTPSTQSSLSMKDASGPYLQRQPSGIYSLTTSRSKTVSSLSEVPKGYLHSGVLAHIIVPVRVEEVPEILAQSKAKNAGAGWFNMPATEITEDLKKDLLVLKNRGALDPKRFYKRQDTVALPKFFQMGTIIEDKRDIGGQKIARRDKKETFVESMMVEAEEKGYIKRKYAAIQRKKVDGKSKKARFDGKFNKGNKRA